MTLNLRFVALDFAFAVALCLGALAIAVLN